MAFKPTASIKLIIWDLDDTFWTGTLSEGEIELIESNAAIVKTLCDRGIMSSICSKNDFEPVRERLTAAGLWDYFIFPQIAFAPKGQAIMSIIEQANLRPANVLFVDDNPVNLEELRYLSPDLMTALPEDVLPLLLDLPECKGKDDRSHSRLNQYKQLEQKVADFETTTLSNVDFLRQCDIRVRFDYDVEAHAARIIELVNRSNQLNFTKRRLETEEAVAEFTQSLKRHDIFSAVVFARDKYGEHGLVGFYMKLKNEREHQLIHFVFSCRIMNMGLEQYVFEHVGRPGVDVVQPVSNDICYFDSVDWINEMGAGDEEATAPAKRLTLLGSCDLTAVATYCSRDRAEFVNAVQDGVMVRYDDFGFILNDEGVVAASTVLDTVPSWSRAEFAQFRADVASSEILIVSLSAAMKGAYLLTDDGVALRIHPAGLGEYMDFNPGAPFLRHSTRHAIDGAQRETLLQGSLEELQRRTSAANVFLLGANTRNVDGTLDEDEQRLMARYNTLAERFCAATPQWSFVSIDDVVPETALVDPRHYTRLGYHGIAEHIMARVDASIAAPAANADEGALAAPRLEIAKVVAAGRRLSRFNLFGPKSGSVAHLKRAVRLMPFADAVLRRMGRTAFDPASVLTTGKNAA